MKIGSNRNSTSAGATSRTRASAAAAYGRTAAAGEVARLDQVSVMGIPEAELTPKVREAIMTLMREVETLRSELNNARSRLVDLEMLADQDMLAPIANRRSFVRELSRHLSYSQRYGTPSSLIYFDVNQFKTINDTYGHAAGDAALRQVAQVLQEQVRESDVVGRLGGDEFGVILAQADGEAAQEKAASLAQAITDQPVEFDGHLLPLSVSFGVANFEKGQDAADAIKAADEAMYAQKAARRKQSPAA